MKKIFLLFLIVVFIWNDSFCQSSLSLRPEAGWGLTSASIKQNNTTYENENYQTSVLSTISAGVYLKIPLVKKFSFEPGILYAGRGYKQEAGSSQNPNNPSQENLYLRINRIELPLCINYDINLKDAGKLFFFAGPYAGYTFSGRKLIEASGYREKDKLKIGNDNLDDIKPFVAGLAGGVGYEISFGIYVRGCVSFDFTNIAAGKAQKMYNESLAISLGYNLPLNKK